MLRSNRELFQRFLAVAKPYWVSEQRWVAYGWLAAVLLLLAGTTAVNVVLSFVGQHFMTAIASRDTSAFYHYIWVYACCFAGATPLVVLYFYAQDRLALHWRDWLTRHLLTRYFDSSVYYHLDSDATIDNPDERIAHDVREFTKFAVAFFLTIVGSIITVCSFASILWGISKMLVIVVFAYAFLGTLVTLFLGRRLVGLNFDQARYEADLRFNLVQVRANAESIAFYQGEKQERERVFSRLRDVISNFGRVIRWQRNMGFVKTSYDYLVILIPVMFIAPMYFARQIEFGTITQAGDAFSQILGALSLVVVQFRVFSEFLSQVDRIGELSERMDAIEKQRGACTAANTISLVEVNTAHGEKPGLACRKVTMLTPDAQRVLVENLDATVSFGDSLLIMGPSGSGKSSVLRGLAGLWRRGTGEIHRPSLKDMMFLPQDPYMITGASLREQLAYPSHEGKFSDLQLHLALESVGLSGLAKRAPGGLDAQLKWVDVLSPGEKQRLAFARLLLHRPAFAILDEATSGLDAGNEERLYRLLSISGITYVSIGHRDSLKQHHRKLLTLNGTGGWKLTEIQAAA